ncbi:hypothetical protein F4815DRAFT_499585 [Daldinia loculata]|nr:hypothetical protein F4815DRAFT_499585 [Daldinia loculata]
MASYDQLKEPTGEDYTLSFDVGALDIPLDNEPFIPVEMHDQVIDFPHQNPNEIDIAYPEHMLNKYIASETCKGLEKLPKINHSNLASPVHNPDHTQVGNTSDYERYHAEFFGMNSEPDSEDPVPGPVQEPEKESQYPEAYMDPRLLMYDPVFWVCPEQGNNSPNMSSMPQSSTSGLIKDIQAMEPLLAQQSWVSYVAPAPCTKPASYTEPTSYTGLTSYGEPTSNPQSVSYKKPVSYPKPVSHPESVSYPAPVSYVEPVSYPEPISYPESVSPPESMPYTESVFRPQPQPQPLEGNSSLPFRLRPNPITTPASPAPSTHVQKRKYESYYFDKAPATQYGQTVGQFISQYQARSKTPCTEPVVNGPACNQSQMSLSPQEQERPSKKAKVPSGQEINAKNL